MTTFDDAINAFKGQVSVVVRPERFARGVEPDEAALVGADPERAVGTDVQGVNLDVVQAVGNDGQDAVPLPPAGAWCLWAG